LKHGTWKVWDAQGVLRSEMHYHNGARVGNWKSFDENGKLIESVNY
jgi:antitoxin component YwqK of YwqJK toxin-antitoxin module